MKIMCLWASYKKKIFKKYFIFASLKFLNNGVGSGSISQRYGSGDPDPDQNVQDPQRCSNSDPTFE
jgi:hypothetical protein